MTLAPVSALSLLLVRLCSRSYAASCCLQHQERDLRRSKQAAVEALEAQRRQHDEQLQRLERACQVTPVGSELHPGLLS